jgi:multidrug transporter EmrE-like cation transporter
MKALWIVLCVVGYMIASTAAGIQFKLAAEQAGRRALWHFVIGNIIGAFGPLAMTFALRGANANVIYALCFGGAFGLLQIVSSRMFQQPLSPYQWSGIACVGLGILLLHIRPA